MDRLNTWLDIADDRLRAAGFMRGSIADDLATRAGRGDASLQSHRWVGPRGTDVRAASIAGAKVQVINVMGYPIDALRTPVFAMEVVLFGGSVRVAVIDLQPASLKLQAMEPLADAVQEKLFPLWREFQPKVAHGGDLPDWAREQFTPTCIFSRRDSLEDMPVLTEAFEAYLGCWLRDFVVDESGTASASEVVADYQRHHVTHTPGRPFLRNLFGASWAEAYVSQFMYPEATWPQHARQRAVLNTAGSKSTTANARL